MKSSLIIKAYKHIINGSFFSALHNKAKRIIYYYYHNKKITFLNKLNDEEFVYKSKLGFKIIVNKNKVVEKEFYLGVFENEVLKLFRKLVKKNDVVFDVGANIGLFSLTAASKCRNNVSVYAFEPAEYPYKKIKQNIILNELDSINVYNTALGDFKGIVKLNVCNDDAYNSIGSIPQSDINIYVNVPITTLDNFCSENNISNIDILKMDTEGAEYLILKGAKEFLNKFKIPIIFTEYNREVISGYSYTLKDYENFLFDLNYHLFEIQQDRIVKFNSAISNSSNLICIQENYLNYISKKVEITNA